MMSKNENAFKRIPLTPETQQALKDFKHGLGTDYDTAIRILFDVAFGKCTGDKHTIGRMLRPTYILNHDGNSPN